MKEDCSQGPENHQEPRKFSPCHFPQFRIYLLSSLCQWALRLLPAYDRDRWLPPNSILIIYVRLSLIQMAHWDCKKSL